MVDQSSAVISLQESREVEQNIQTERTETSDTFEKHTYFCLFREMSLGHFPSACFHSKTWFSKARLILSA